MSALSADRFTEFYKAAYGRADDPQFGPFPWQARSVRRACAGKWPRVIALPTAAGKTTCIDIAIFALACQGRNAPRRIFFVVDRRLVVDQAELHARELAKALKDAQNGILREVADELRNLAQGDRPLDVYALRGGMYRETAWARSPLQPTVIASTVDQVGSRLLFRGYGVSDSMKPIHAGLVGNDAIILLDEAHCAKPFEQTLRAIEQYRKWGEDDSRPLFSFVSMTATPASDVPEDQIERDDADDRAHPILGTRIITSKPTELVVAAKATGKNWQLKLVEELAKQARELAAAGFAAVGVLVNRVATARLLANELNAVLLTGRMRQLDRDRLFKEKLRPLLSNVEGTPPQFVVGTQCLEVGADFDFHALVTECASLDALRQRFGRLNRVAARSDGKGVIVIRADQADDCSDDPVYGASLAATWKWLNQFANKEPETEHPVIDFGIASIREKWETTPEESRAAVSAPALDAPVLFPTHLDCWVQTNPIPSPDPDPAVFLHGTRSAIPDVQVVFRADLGENPDSWADIVALCPPSSSEALPVRLGTFRKWLAGQEVLDESSDVEGEPERDTEELELSGPVALRWKGAAAKETGLVRAWDFVRPGDTFVIPVSAPRASALGDFPNPSQPPADYADEAFQRSRDRAILRLVGLDLTADDEEFEDKLSAAIEARMGESPDEWLQRAVQHLVNPKNRLTDPHPLGGWVVSGKKRLHGYDPAFLEDDESSESPNRRSVTLDDHSRGVSAYACRYATGCGLPVDLYKGAGLYHDLGKLDPRFQAMLQGRSPRMTAPPPLAKSGRSPGSRREREEARAIHRYPKGGRHELLSAALVAAKTQGDLLLHLIATHHGSARPFGGRVEENEFSAEPFSAVILGQSYELASSAQVPEIWNKSLAERFWRVVRKYGWWGAAYREAVFRLADHAQSRAEQEDGWMAEPKDVELSSLSPTAPVSDLECIELTGLDGSNPLGFLAGVGVLRLACQAFKGQAMLHWRRHGHWMPVLHIPAGNDLINHLHRLVHRLGDTSAKCQAELLEKEYRKVRKAVEKARKQVKDRKLRGTAREAAIAAEVIPLEAKASAARARWLRALDLAVPARFLSLGKALSVTEDEFRAFARRTADQLITEGSSARHDADFAPGFGCEACILDSGKIVPTEFQLITGSGHQYFLETMSKLMAAITQEQLRRAVFGPWTYSDLRLSFRWDPIDDRRYAYGWADPSDDAVQTEHGANLLAAFALPLFPVIPTLCGQVTTGFAPASDPLAFTWPIWLDPLTTDSVRSLLALERLQAQTPDRSALRQLGVADVFRTRKIEVGSGLNTKLNLTSAISV